MKYILCQVLYQVKFNTGWIRADILFLPKKKKKKYTVFTYYEKSLNQVPYKILRNDPSHKFPVEIEQIRINPKVIFWKIFLCRLTSNIKFTNLQIKETEKFLEKKNDTDILQSRVGFVERSRSCPCSARRLLVLLEIP